MACRSIAVVFIQQLGSFSPPCCTHTRYPVLLGPTAHDIVLCETYCSVEKPSRVAQLLMLVFSNNLENTAEMRFSRICINTHMRTKQTRQYSGRKVALDEQLADKLIALGLVESLSDLSRQMGRNTTYFACMKKRGYSLHIGSLVFLASKLSNELNASSCVRTRATLRSAIAAINETIQAKCEIREQELLGQ